jgi:very-short-patch-repair endonuclease
MKRWVPPAPPAVGAARAPKKKREPSKIEERFALHLRAAQVFQPVREYAFSPTRAWRLDFAWPELKIAVEVEGGIWTGGRHTNASGFIKDLEKYNALALAGWRLFRFDGGAVRRGEALRLIEPLVRLPTFSPGYM